MKDTEENELVWSAQAGSQVSFLSCPIYECMMHGPRGTGKTDAMLVDFLKDVGMGYGPEIKGVLFRRTFPELADVINKTQKLFPLLAPGAKYNSANHVWKWPTGEVLYLRFIDKESDYLSHHGFNYTWIGWEELCTWASPAVYKKMQSTLRSSHPKVAKLIRIRATANPLGPGHGWVKKHFKIDGKQKIKVIREKNEDTGNYRERCSIFSELKENKALMKADPMYLDKLYAACKGNQAYIDSWIKGSWDIIAGGMFDDLWEPKRHIVKDFRIPDNWKIQRSFDWGSSKPFSVGWWAVSDGDDYQSKDGKWHSTVKGDKFRIAEWYGSTGEDDEGLRMVSSDIAIGIIERELSLGIYHKCLGGFADPAIYQSHDGDPIAIRMSKWFTLEDGRQYKGPTFQKADNARVAGWESVRDHLINAIPDQEGMREHPGLFIFMSCIKCVELLCVTQRDEKKPDDVDTKTEDHLQDELRYFIKGSRSTSGGSGRVERGHEVNNRIGRVTYGRVKQI